MGKLRDGILALQKNSINMEPQIAELEKHQDDLSEQVFAAGKRIGEGLNALVLYLMEKFKHANTTFEAQGDKLLKEHLDPTSTKFAHGIVEAKNDVKKIVARLAAEQKASAEKLLLSIKASETGAASLKSIADKKKSKWLASSKYKTKIGGYLAALTAIEGILVKQAETITGLAAIHQNDTWVERNYKFNPDMTIKQVRSLASIELESNLKDFNLNKDAIMSRRRQFRDEYKSLGNQFGIMKKWVEEADQMEAESEEK